MQEANEEAPAAVPSVSAVDADEETPAASPAAEQEVQEHAAGNVALAAYPSQRDECVVCLDQPKAVICAPCGHKNMCTDCAEILMSSEDSRCPTCRSKVLSTIQAIWEV